MFNPGKVLLNGFCALIQNLLSAPCRATFIALNDFFLNFHEKNAFRNDFWSYTMYLKYVAFSDTSKGQKEIESY